MFTIHIVCLQDRRPVSTIFVMQSYKTQAGRIDDRALKACVLALKNGEVICYPTETFYALGIDYFNDTAMEKLFELKGRPAEKAFPCIASDNQQVEEYCDTSHKAYKLLSSKFWPGPLTLVLPLKKLREQTVAVRVSSHAVARQISAALHSLIVSTSANRSGEAAIQNPDSLPAVLTRGISVLIDAGKTYGGQASTIVSLIADQPELLREGAIPFSQIQSVL